MACLSATEPQCRDNEMGYMFYQDFSGDAFQDFSGNQPPFRTIEPPYWSGTELSANPSQANSFVFGNGEQFIFGKDGEIPAWAVRDGDVTTAVPLPAGF